jgi:hypothetical protein
VNLVLIKLKAIFLSISLDKFDDILLKYIENNIDGDNFIYNLNKRVKDITLLCEELISLNRIGFLFKKLDLYVIHQRLNIINKI